MQQTVAVSESIDKVPSGEVGTPSSTSPDLPCHSGCAVHSLAHTGVEATGGRPKDTDSINKSIAP